MDATLEKSSPASGTRLLYLDVLRVLATFMVLVNHTSECFQADYTPLSLAWWSGSAWFFMSKPAVPLFLMITGATLLAKPVDYKKTAHRFLRIVLVILLFSFPYYIKNCLVDGVPIRLGTYLFTIYQSYTTNAYWYLYLYLAILLMSPLLQRLMQALSKKDFIYFFVFALGFCGLMPLLNHYFPATIYCYVFELPLFNVYLGYLAVGYFLVHRTTPTKKGAYIAGVVLLLFTLGNILFNGLDYITYQGAAPWGAVLENRCYINIIIPSVCLFYVSAYLSYRFEQKNRFVGAVTLLAKLSFGIYLLGDMCIGLFRPVYAFCMAAGIPSIFSLILWEVLAFAAGAAATWILQHIPAVRRLL